jgi:hypothetical protein
VRAKGFSALRLAISKMQFLGARRPATIQNKHRALAVIKTASSHMQHMRAWTESAIKGYYADPPIIYLKAGNRDRAGAGHYIVPHCEPDCCDAFGGVSKIDFGPFNTAAAAREWSRNNLIDN